MKIILAYDARYGADPEADLGDAFWLVDSPDNRARASEAWGSGASDPNSAVFAPPERPAAVTDVVARLEAIELHHANWSEVVVIGVEPTHQVRVELGNAGFTLGGAPDRLSLLRPP